MTDDDITCCLPPPPRRSWGWLCWVPTVIAVGVVVFTLGYGYGRRYSEDHPLRTTSWITHYVNTCLSYTQYWSDYK